MPSVPWPREAISRAISKKLNLVCGSGVDRGGSGFSPLWNNFEPTKPFLLLCFYKDPFVWELPWWFSGSDSELLKQRCGFSPLSELFPHATKMQPKTEN